jgi:hypothetical protein
LFSVILRFKAANCKANSPVKFSRDDDSHFCLLLRDLQAAEIKEKQPPYWVTAFEMLALPIVPGRYQPSIVSTNELNFRVRNGNGCTLIVINTNCVSFSWRLDYNTTCCDKKQAKTMFFLTFFGESFPPTQPD